MNVSGSMRGTLVRVVCAVIAAVVWLISPAGIVGNVNGQQQTPPQGQQGCPAPNAQNNGQQPQQSNGQQNGANNQPNPNCNQPAPLFGGSLSIKKSNQSTDSAALGFNGVDPNGQVQQAFLNASPSADSEKKALALAASRPSPADLAAFEKEGGLTQSTAPAAGTTPKSN